MAVLSTSANIATPGLPVGSIQAFAGANAPTGWLLCDGNAVRRQDYPDLYNTLGTTYGSGDGSTTFNLPDLRGRIPIGAGNDGSAANGVTRSRGDKGGDTRVGDHAHLINFAASSAGFFTNGSGSSNRMIYMANNSVGSGATTNHWTAETASKSRAYADSIHANVDSKLSDGTGENMPPFLVTNYIIKATADIARGGWYTQSSPPFVTQLPTNPAIGEECYYLHTAAGNIGAVAHLRYDGSRWNPIGQTTLCRWNCGSATQVFSSTSVTNVTVGDYGTLTFTPPWDGYYEIGQKTGMWELNSGIGMYTMFSATDGSANYSIHYIQDWNGPYQHHREGESHPIVYYLYASKTYRFTATLTYAAGNTGTINFFGTGYVKAVS